MGVYINGMDMPKRCIDCPFMVSDDDDNCVLQTKEANSHFTSWEDMKANCPLVEVKSPHGRLIDADALMNEMDKQENALYEHGHEFSFSFKSGGDVCTAWYNVEMMVEDAPTIIPAKEG